MVPQPTILYVLRMNAEGIGVEIEEYPFEDYPALKAYFCNPMQTITNSFEERTLVGRYVGEERLINFSIYKWSIEKEKDVTLNTMREFRVSLEKTRNYLRNIGYDDWSEEENYSNIDICSFSYSFYLYGKSFIELKYRLGNLLRTDAILAEYDVPCWQIQYLHSGSFTVHEKLTFHKEKKTFDEWFEYITKEPEDVISKKEMVLESIKDVYEITISKDDILYNFAEKSYVLKKDIERLILKELLPEKDIKTKEIAKYTTFETLLSILQSGKIRMNSVVSMNDKTETDFLEDVIRNYKEDNERDIDKYLFADRDFITSFTKRIDELDMWRLYGDNAKGVCMVFERVNMADDKLYKIKYINPEEDLSKVEQLFDNLKDKNIRFSLNLLKEYRHFLKHSDYISEDEYRVLESSKKPDGWFVNCDNRILTPYLEREVKRVDRVKYPFRLHKIIVGPAFMVKEVNIMQLFYMSYQSGFSLEIANSTIESYR